MKKILFVSSTGGHLNELLQLKPMFKKYDSYIITEKTETNLKLKEEYHDKINFLIYGTKHKPFTYFFKLIYNFFKCIYFWFKIKPDVIISTGAHTGGLMCLVGKILGSKIIYIETFANIKTKTITGKLVYKFADLFVVQWESMLELYPKAVCWGWIF